MIGGNRKWGGRGVLAPGGGGGELGPRGLTDGDLSVVALSENVAEAPWLTAIQDVRSIVGENLDLLLGDAAVATVLQVRAKKSFNIEKTDDRMPGLN